jgi:preprotein translocase subunit Sec63
MSKNAIMNETMEIFYRELADIINYKQILVMLCKAQEFQELENFVIDEAEFEKVNYIHFSLRKQSLKLLGKPVVELI